MSANGNSRNVAMKTRYLACIGLSLSAAVAMAANDAASGPKHRDDPASPVEYLAHIPRLQYVNAILISPDGGTVATLRGENTSWNEGGKPLALQVWSVPGGDLVWTARSQVFRLLTFSPDGKRLVGMTEDTRVTLWDTATGRVRSRLSARNVSFSAAVFSLDGQTLMTSINRFEGGGGIPMQPSSGAIQLWRAKNGRLLRELTAQTRPVWALAISPDGKSLAAAQPGPGPEASVNLLDLASDSTRHTLLLGADTFHVSSLAFSPDGRWLAAASGTHDAKGEVRLWDVASGELKRRVTDSDLGAMSVVGWEAQVAFSPRGTILAIAGDDQTINLWGLASDKWRGSLGPDVPSQPGRYVLQFVRDGLLLASVNWFQQVEVKLWNYPGNQQTSADDR
jgi:WD40 repeat protein